MAKILVKDLHPNDTIDSVFIVSKKQLITSKNTGKDYVTLQLADVSGTIEAKWWDNFSEDFPTLNEGSFVRVYAGVQEYNGKAQLTIKKVRLAKEDEYLLSDFIRHTEKNIEQLFKDLVALVNSFTDQDLKELLNLFLSDETLVHNLKRAPAAVNMHSACIGGLLEHISNVITLALFVCGEYKNINRDLLLTGVILHDIGKTRELEYVKIFKYTDVGRLVGHITISVEMLHEKLALLKNFPAEKKMLLEHLILAHHGTNELGSPREPMTLEAVVLNLIDNLDAKVVGFNEFVENNRQPDSNWTNKAFMFDNRSLYISRVD